MIPVPTERLVPRKGCYVSLSWHVKKTAGLLI